MERAASPNRSIGQRTVIITGGNTGLGYACATALLRSKAVPTWHVILACRDTGRADAAVCSGSPPVARMRAASRLWRWT